MKIASLNEGFYKHLGPYYDREIGFEILGERNLRVVSLDSHEAIFEVGFEEPLLSSFIIYKSLDSDISFEISDNQKAEDLEGCRFELVKIYFSDDSLLIFGDELLENRHYGRRVIVSLSAVETVSY